MDTHTLAFLLLTGRGRRDEIGNEWCRTCDYYHKREVADRAGWLGCDSPRVLLRPRLVPRTTPIQ